MRVLGNGSYTTDLCESYADGSYRPRDTQARAKISSTFKKKAERNPMSRKTWADYIKGVLS